mmetsp:Transcript_14515/g.22070  ORF Transcript_14515/g.22070 Transcript_14515/m.22070 type:complete len:298 (+) Transcript_14515:198-1091(+)
MQPFAMFKSQDPPGCIAQSSQDQTYVFFTLFFFFFFLGPSFSFSSSSSAAAAAPASLQLRGEGGAGVPRLQGDGPGPARAQGAEDVVEGDPAQVQHLGLGALRVEVLPLRGGGVGDEAVHARGLRRPQAHQRVLHHHALPGRQAQLLPGQVVDHGVGLLQRHVVAGHHHVQPGQPLLAHHRVHHLLEAGLGGGGADADGDVRRGDGGVHQLQHPGPGRGHLRHHLLVDLGLLVLQVVDEGRPLVLGGRDGAARLGGRGPPAGVVREVVLHLGLPAAHGVLQLVVVVGGPLHGLAVHL